MIDDHGYSKSGHCCDLVDQFDPLFFPTAVRFVIRHPPGLWIVGFGQPFLNLLKEPIVVIGHFMGFGGRCWCAGNWFSSQFRCWNYRCCAYSVRYHDLFHHPVIKLFVDYAYYVSK